MNKPIIDKKALIVLLSLLLICITPVLYHELGGNGSIGRLLTSCLYSLPLCFLLLCIQRKWLFSIIVILLTVMSVMETIMVALYGNYLVAGNILAVFTTTSDEGTDFLLNTLHAFPYIIPCLIALWLTIYHYRKVSRPWFCLSLIALLTVLSLCVIIMQTNKAKQTMRFYVKQNVLERPPFNFLNQMVNIIEQQKKRQLISESETMAFGAKHLPVESKEVYVLAIGESCRYSNLSLAGYNRQTTPLLEKLDNVVLYSNYYSTANLTMYSVPQILTRATPDNFELNYKEKSIFKPFQECGFKTFAICCKNLLNHEKYLTNGVDCFYSVEDDIEIPHLIDSLSNQHTKSFFIVQFFGNHSFYNNFDEAHNVYHPNIVSEPDSKSSELYVNSYDNTMLFTDSVLTSIIKSIDTPDTQSAFLFVSDHGEDFRPGTGGHGGNSRPNKEEYHVPFIFWYSNIWADHYPKKKDALIENKDKPINADNVFYTVCDMADIEVSSYYSHTTWSVLSDNLQLHDRYLIVPDGKNYIKLK